MIHLDQIQVCYACICKSVFKIRKSQFGSQILPPCYQSKKKLLFLCHSSGGHRFVVWPHPYRDFDGNTRSLWRIHSEPQCCFFRWLNHSACHYWVEIRWCQLSDWTSTGQGSRGGGEQGDHNTHQLWQRVRPETLNRFIFHVRQLFIISETGIFKALQN